MRDLRKEIIKLAQANPELRPHLVPLIRASQEKKAAYVNRLPMSYRVLLSKVATFIKWDQTTAFAFCVALLDTIQATEEAVLVDRLLSRFRSEAREFDESEAAYGINAAEGVEAGREHGEKGKGYGDSPSRDPGKWEPEAKGQCYYETGDPADRCYVTENGGPGGQKKPSKPTTKNWKEYEKQRWGE